MRLILTVALSLFAVSVAHADTAIRVGWCAITISAAPYPMPLGKNWAGSVNAAPR
jgi:hypothetical protein